MESNADLVKVLRNTMRMIRRRGFHGVDLREQTWIGYLSNPHLGPDYITTRYDPHASDANIVNRMHQEPVVGEIVTTYVSKPQKTLRVLMSDVFVRVVDGQTERCFVYFAPQTDTTLKTGDLTEFLSIYNKTIYQLNFGVIISAHPMFSSEVFDSVNPGFRLTHFTDEEISFDPTAHIYTSPMRILSRSEKAAFLTNPGIKTLSSMPRVFVNEPTIKYIGAVPDDVIEYEVESFIPETLLSSELFYRCVRRPTERKKKVR